MAILLANNATSTLAGSITDSATSIAVQSGDASLFPSPTGGDWFPVTVEDGAGNMEIMKCTERASAVLTVERAQEGTTGFAFSAGARVDIRLTKAVMDDKADQADVDSALDLKAPLASPALTGNPTAPTQTAGNDSTRLATTAFVQAALAGYANAFAETGDVKMRYGTGERTGWVRMNGRTIGSGASGATERAAADCEDLFTFLWDADSTLTVSGGRGASAAADWAADKTIALPDLRDRAPAGLGDMGNSAAGRIADSLVDGGEDSSTLGATAGASTHTLTEAEMPAHDHTFSGNSVSGHSVLTDVSPSGGSPVANIGYVGGGSTKQFTTVGAHTPSGSISSEGGDGAHNNIQPTMFMTFYVKL